VKSEHDPICSY
jgi:hypothetical protein